MAKALRINTKRLKLDQINTIIVVTISVAAVVAVFTIVASKMLISQYAYQKRVISAENTALTQFKDDAQATTYLKSAYESFINTNTNVLGGSPNGTGVNDGTNAQIVLDALPSKYDYPALLSSLEQLLENNPNTTVGSFGGTDEQLTQQSDQTSINPVPVAMPFSFSVTAPYADIQTLINTLQLCIRPINIQSINFNGNDNALTMSISANTYYQPEKIFNISSEIIK
ncbi:MAG TPA: type 4a pilus biogenesis protein PilO [Candidatus Saccharimonadales bacterium]|jgi:Tfp pilus assembly protein PilO|nr:type 4a pilus biogenesis protein PilO [Candidatus Saccharimonadales bacterium]